MSSKQSAPKSARKSSRDGRVSRAGEPSRTPATPAVAGPAAPRPGRLTGAAALTALEGVTLLISGVYLLVMGIAGKPQSPQQAEMLAVTVLVLAVLPLAAARGLWQLKRWSRGPAMITQIMALPVAWTLGNAGGTLLAAGVALALVAVAALVLLVNPTATEALGIGPREG
ncbi:hypothetical protein [Streptomyces sp. NPDC002537]